MNENKTLVIVESPSKGKTIQNYLGDDYVVIASMGHIMELGSGGFKGIGVDVENNFKTYYNVMQDKMELIDKIIALAEQCKAVYLFSDADREGECIANHIHQLIKALPKPIKRISSVEITKSGIESAIKNSRDIDLNLVKAQETRRVLDRIIGYMVSPFLMTYYGNNLSAGRVQSVAVRMIVDREKEIINFKPEEYHTILAEFITGDSSNFTAKYDKKISSQQEADDIKEKLLTTSDFTVCKVSSKQRKENPPEPMITSKLQQVMAKRYHLDPEETMRSAQFLYENGYCTYIRTDSVAISNDALVKVRNWLNSNNFEIPKNANSFAAKKGAQEAHECIRPTNVSDTGDKLPIAGNDKLVYEVIWKAFVASQMMPAIYNTLEVRVLSNQHKDISFRASGKALKDPGYLKIFGNVEKTEINIPLLTKNQQITINKNNLKFEKKYTKPPARYNVAALLEDLESKQIGRPATYAQICKTITSRNYVELTNNVYKPTELGNLITEKLISLFDFLDYNYCANLELKLDQIESGKINYLDVLKEFFSTFKTKLISAYQSHGAQFCKSCQYPMAIRKNKTTGETFSICINAKNCRRSENAKSPQLN